MLGVIIMAKKRLNTSVSVNTDLKLLDPIITPVFTDPSRPHLDWTGLSDFVERSPLVQELTNSLTLISRLSGDLEYIAFQHSLSNQLLTWPVITLKRFRALLRRLITETDALNSKPNPKVWGSTTSSSVAKTSIPRTKSSYPGAARLSRRRTMTASLKRRTRPSILRSKRSAKKRAKR